MRSLMSVQWGIKLIFSTQWYNINKLNTLTFFFNLNIAEYKRNYYYILRFLKPKLLNKITNAL